MMYQLAEKNKVMSLFHKGQSVSQIRLKSNVSKSTLYRWKAEYDTTGKIIGYIRKGNLEAARREISQFQEGHKKSSALLTGKVINQFICFNYLDDAKELAEEFLKQNPNNLPVRSQLVTIAKRKGDWEEVERLSREILALDPNDMIARRQIKSCEKMKKGQQRRSDRESRRTNQKDEETPREVHSIQHNVKVIRRQIREGTFSLDDIEQRNKEMQEMGIEETQRNLLIAEAYEKQNFPKQTKIYLKRALQSTQDPKQQKAIKALIETAQAKKKPGQKIDPWNISTAIISSKSNVQVSKVPDEK